MIVNFEDTSADVLIGLVLIHPDRQSNPTPYPDVTPQTLRAPMMAADSDFLRRHECTNGI